MATSETGRIAYYLYNPKYPSYSKYGLKSLVFRPNLLSEKTSVDTGSFIPGTYRVNPYHVKSISENIDYAAGRCNPAQMSVRAHRLLSPYFGDQNVYFIQRNQNVVCLIGDAWRGVLLQQAADQVTLRTAADYEQLSLQKAYGKLGKADLGLGETLGEYRETIQMLRSPLSGLKKFLLDDRTRNLNLLTSLVKRDKREVNRLMGRTGKASLDAMSGTWLELRYGLRPLIGLVQDVVDRVQNKKDEIIDPERIRSVKSCLTFTSKRFVDVKIPHTYDTGVEGKVLVEDTYKSMASVQYRQTDAASFLDSLGLTPRFLPETAWELTRLSFVWDWLFSVGPWLATLRINPSIEVLGNTSGFKIERYATLEAPKLYSRWPAYDWQFEEGIKGACNAKDRHCINQYDRKVDLALQYRPHFTWGRTLDLFKAIDSVSLTWQSLSKKLPKKRSR